MNETKPATVLKDGEEFLPVTEGSATILFPNTNEVFYNPVQQFNRDMVGVKSGSTVPSQAHITTLVHRGHKNIHCTAK
jgi:tRNA G26 N,N-dimethylase Trm1